MTVNSKNSRKINGHVVERTNELRRTLGALSESRAGLNRRLIETASRIKRGEARIDESERRLDELGEREERLKSSLSARHETASAALAALQRIGRSLPPVLVAEPGDVLAAMRSVALLEQVVSSLRREVAELDRDLSALTDLRARIDRERRQLLASGERLREERVQMKELLETKRAALAITEAELLETRRRAEKLARETKTLKELIARTAMRKEKAAAAKGGQKDKKGEKRGFGRTEPAIAFGKAKGTLPFPVHGRLKAGFGQKNTLGYPSRGVSISTRSGAQVTSPADGWVVYAGPFRSYGRLLILNVGGGYHIVLAGLERIDVGVGRFVLLGEPVGAMGAGASAARSVLAGEAAGDPLLYVEFRKGGNAVDPGPWWADARG